MEPRKTGYDSLTLDFFSQIRRDDTDYVGAEYDTLPGLKHRGFLSIMPPFDGIHLAD